MKIEKGIFLLALCGPVLYWTFDSAVDSRHCYDRPMSFWDAAIYKIPLTKFYERTAVSLAFLFFALLMYQALANRRRIKRALQESEARFGLMYDEAPVGYHELDVHGRIVRVNRTELEMLGYAAEDMLGRPAWEFVIEKELSRGAVEAKLAGTAEPASAFERTFIKKDGTPVAMLVEDRLLRDRSGRIVGLRSTLQDISWRKKTEQEAKELEAQLQRAQKLESLGVLAGGIAHDFNNLLTVISGNAEYLRKSLNLDSGQAGVLRDIETAAKQAADITQALHTFSRPTQPVIRPVEVNALVTEVHRLLRRAVPATIQFKISPAPEPCYIEADPGQVQQILVNLCLNARDAMPKGGVLEIRTAPLAKPQLPGKARNKAFFEQYVGIWVDDTGCGMDEQTLQKAFDPYFSTKPKERNSGLGLAIVYRIVEAHNGLIDLTSQPGQGTQAAVFLPAGQAPETAEEQAWPPRSQPAKRILVVEDEEMIASLLRTILENRGYTALTTPDPQRAIALCGSAQPPIDLAIIDYASPVMAGDQCLTEMRKIRPKLKAIIIAGQKLTPGDLPIPDCRVVYKPFTMPQIAQAVREALA